MQITLEIIGAIIIIGLIALGVEKYIEFLKARTRTDKPDSTANGEKDA